MADKKGMYTSLSDDVLAGYSKNGDDNAFNELVIRYLKLIRFIARKYSAQGYEQNDFVQEGLMALLYACKTYDAHGGSSFGRYVSLLVERRFISIFRSSQSKKAVPEAMLVHIDSLEGELTDYVCSPEEQLKYEVLLLFASGLSYSRISSRLNISEKAVDNALQRARRKIGKSDMS